MSTTTPWGPCIREPVSVRRFSAVLLLNSKHKIRRPSCLIRTAAEGELHLSCNGTVLQSRFTGRRSKWLNSKWRCEHRWLGVTRICGDTKTEWVEERRGWAQVREDKMAILLVEIVGHSAFTICGGLQGWDEDHVVRTKMKSMRMALKEAPFDSVDKSSWPRFSEKLRVDNEGGWGRQISCNMLVFAYITIDQTVVSSQ